MHYLREFNPCHEPGGSDQGGRWARKGTGICHPAGQSKTTPLSTIPYTADEAAEAVWANAFGKRGVTIQDVANAMAVGTHSANPVKVTHTTDGFKFVINRGDVVAERHINRRDDGGWDAYHDALFLQDKSTGKGLGKVMLAETFRVYDRMGIKEVGLEANVDVGSYAWARYGFDNAPETTRGGEAFKAGTRNRAMFLKDAGVLSMSQVADLATASITPGGGVWKVADLRTKVPAREATALIDAFLDKFDPDGDISRESRTRLHADARNGVLPVGKLLLMNRYWHGKFRMSNPAQRDRLRAYVGRDVFRD